MAVRWLRTGLAARIPQFQGYAPLSLPSLDNINEKVPILESSPSSWAKSILVSLLPSFAHPSWRSERRLSSSAWLGRFSYPPLRYLAAVGRSRSMALCRISCRARSGHDTILQCVNPYTHQSCAPGYRRSSRHRSLRCGLAPQQSSLLFLGHPPSLERARDKGVRPAPHHSTLPRRFTRRVYLFRHLRLRH